MPLEEQTKNTSHFATRYAIRAPLILCCVFLLSFSQRKKRVLHTHNVYRNSSCIQISLRHPWTSLAPEEHQLAFTLKNSTNTYTQFFGFDIQHNIRQISQISKLNKKTNKATSTFAEMLRCGIFLSRSPGV